MRSLALRAHERDGLVPVLAEHAETRALLGGRARRGSRRLRDLADGRCLGTFQLIVTVGWVSHSLCPEAIEKTHTASRCATGCPIRRS